MNVDILAEMGKITEEIKSLISEIEDTRKRVANIESMITRIYNQILYDQTHNETKEKLVKIQEKLKEKVYYVRSTNKVFDWTIIVELFFDLNGAVICDPVIEIRNPYVKEFVSPCGHKALETFYGRYADGYMAAYSYRKICFIDIDGDSHIEENIQPHIVFYTNRDKIGTKIHDNYLEFYDKVCVKIAKEMGTVQYKESKYNNATLNGIDSGIFNCLRFGPIGIAVFRSLKRGEQPRYYLENYGGYMYKAFTPE